LRVLNVRQSNRSEVLFIHILPVKNQRADYHSWKANHSFNLGITTPVVVHFTVQTFNKKQPLLFSFFLLAPVYFSTKAMLITQNHLDGTCVLHKYHTDYIATSP
jgi:hypothetical protein